MSSNPNNIMSSNPIKNIWQERAEKLKQIKLIVTCTSTASGLFLK